MSDEVTAGPTPAQIAAKGLVVVDNPQSNGQPLRSWDPKHEDFPPIALAYGIPAKVTPPTIVEYEVTVDGVPTFDLAAGSTFIVPAGPTMPAGQIFDGWADGQHVYQPGWTYTMQAEPVNLTVEWHWAPVVDPPVVVPPASPLMPPAGMVIPSPDAGMKRVAADGFLTKTLSAMWGGIQNAYNGVSGGDQDGLFSNKHLILLGDGLMRLQMYPDSVNAALCYTPPGKVLATIRAAVADWLGAGIQCAMRYPAPVTFWWISRYDVYPGVTPICLGWPNTWPPEKDWLESYNSIRGTVKGQAINSLEATYHWGTDNEQEQETLTGFDFSQWHLWKVVTTPTGETLYVDNKAVASVTYTAEMLAGPDGINTAYGLTFQIQSGDPDNPPADPTITAATPVEMLVAGVAIDVPA
jgi:hypothetical protein